MENTEKRYIEALDYIHSFEKFGWVLGLDRIKKLLNILGDPQKDLKFIHVAGTNGKGSTTMMCSNILVENGYKVGTYTSPFVVDFRERFQVNLQMIAKEEFVELVDIVAPIIKDMADNGEMITEFEAITTIAFLYFKKSNCDIVCLEVGLGGNYDATNIIDTPLVSVITSISLDHVNILGDSIEKIAGEKAGIIKKNGVCVCYAKQDIDAVAVIMEKCAKENARFIQPNKNAIEVLESDIFGSRFKIEDEEYGISMGLKHQIYNASTVIETMRQLNTLGFAVNKYAIKTGLKKTKFNARFEVLSEKPLIVVDGAHNFEGVSSLAENIKDIKAGKKIAIMGMLSDKDFSNSLKCICEQVDEIISVPVNNPRALLAKDLCNEAKKYCANASYFNDLKEAYDYAVTKTSENDMLLVCGSLYMVGDMRKIIIDDIK